jgi:SPP1 gp7 family putative phage head morphogenesis protein|nr:MAG TPA: minor capsid protein [Caudoviricetes sp.]
MTREIKKAYKRVANNLIKRLALVNPDTMTYDYLRQTAKYLEKEYKKLNKRLNKDIEKAIISTVEGYTQSQVEFYSDLCKPLSSSFEDMFSKVNKQVLDNVITGKMYGDNIKLSDRLWSNHNKTIKTINDILTDGFITGKNSKDIAKDLEVYCNPDYLPDYLKEYEKFTIHPKSKNKVEFNSYRLANTYINHAYQEATRQSAKENPFVEKIEWLSGTDDNVCDLCKERNGKRFKVEDIPLDHP